MNKFLAVVVLALFTTGVNAAVWIIDSTAQNGVEGALSYGNSGVDSPTLGLVGWFTIGTNGGGTHIVNGRGIAPGNDYACYGLTDPAHTCTNQSATVIWNGTPSVFSGSVNDDFSFMDLSWTGQHGTEVPFGVSESLFVSTVLSGTYDASGNISGGNAAGAGYDADGFSCWNNPNNGLPGQPSFCGNTTGVPWTVSINGPQTKFNRELPLGITDFVDNGDGTISIDMGDSTYADCVADGACTPGSNSSDVFAQWTVVAHIGSLVPDVVDDLVQDAINTINAVMNDGKNLVAGTPTTDFSDTILAGNVISTDPVADTIVEADSTVDILESLGPAFDVPDVEGDLQADAEMTLTNASLTSSVTTQNDVMVPVDRVISQNPTTCTACVAEFTEIALVVSLGPPTTADVPDVIDTALAAAEAAIAAEFLTSSFTSAADNSIAAGNVAMQNPTACTACATPGSNVALVVSTGVGDAVVPNVIDDPQALAESKIFNANLTSTTTDVNSETVAIGAVVSQNPADGAPGIVPGSNVALEISLGTPVPDVVDDPQATAEAAIAAVQLTSSTTSANSETIAIGSVISQTPTAAGGNVEPMSNVALVISLGTPVPDVVGQPQATAEANIAAVQLTSTTTSASDPMVPIGNVISQMPAGGNVEPMSNVALVISLGNVIDVPDVVGEQQATAESTITGAGLTVGTVSMMTDPTIPSGDVISQSPTACSLCVAPGSPVDLVISTGPGTATVPPVIGQDQADAETAIAGAGFTVGAVTDANSTTVPIDVVIDQSPDGGTTATTGSAVDLTVSLGALVPSLTGVSQADAQAQIVADGLTLGKTVTERNNFVAAGDVIRQEPAGNTNAEPGTPVDLVISTGAFSTGQKDSNAMDPWTLLLLMAVPLLRRRRR